ncbi:uncharacterized protein PFL1_03972 [Pseudozyma flocculosa PF-1]|uniref:Uncharacterized protein n=2 Tax=Pseudozyma flocculosa TaxID=84751 RepID=A0A5C3EWL7_9BASI|nr:uncharacterized protein PFL1_03972 [Pseudozyma flocculosa PF-1]EPQ28669.1 hypothetical protein PFL1_03972 [Pseudozyma flocculosa PF-1]SPO36618.1 uncharacterized protein PSFLO_02089 [Pseudozyma flocculosa]
MADRDEERQPLLAQQRRPEVDGAHAAPWHRRLARSWPIIRVLVFATFYGIAFYSGTPTLLDQTRAFTCAFHYERHPELWPLSPGSALPLDSDHPCAVPGVEAKFGVVNAISSFASMGLSSISMLFYGPRLSTWGRKPLITLATFSCMFGLLPYILLPLGYPYGPLPDSVAVSPTVSLGLVLLASCLQGLMGDTALVYLVMNALAVDASRPETRSIYLSWILTATLIGCFVGPTLAAWVIQRSRRIKAVSTALMQAAVTAYRWVEHPKHGNDHGSVPGHGIDTGDRPVFGAPSDGDTGHGVPRIPAPPGPPGVPPQQPPSSLHGNTAALRSALLLYAIALLWVIFVIPETVKRGGDAKNTASRTGAAAAAQEPSAAAESVPPSQPSEVGLATKLFRRLGPLSVFLPVVLSSGERDYRVTKMGCVVMLSTFGAMGLTYIAIFSSYRFDWGPEKIGFFLTLIGGTRAVMLMLGIPAINRFLDRVVPRTAPVAASTCDQGGDEDEDGEQDEERSTSIDAVPRRARIDIYVAMVSFLIEWIGYLVIILGASTTSLTLMSCGTIFLSLGAGANPALNSAAISIVTSRRRHLRPDDGDGDGSAAVLARQTSDGWISASSIVDSFFKFFSPLCYTAVYSLTIDSRAPAACFFIPIVSFGAATALLWSIL